MIKSLIRIMAIAWLTVRDAIRSKLLVSLSALLVTGLVSLPLLMSGDNTLNGQLEVILQYTLGFALAMLSLVTLWAACGGISAEIQDRRLYLVLAKPVHRHELWLGKWLGIVGINAVLLLLTGAIVGTMVRHTLRSSPESAAVKRQVREQYLQARDALYPLPSDWTVTARDGAEAIVRSGRAPAGMTLAAIQTQLLKELEDSRFTVAPGGSTTFSYKLPDGIDTRHDLILNYTFESTRPERAAVSAEWLFTTAMEHPLRLAVTNYPGIPNAILIPGGLIQGTNRLTATYHRLDPANPATLMLAQSGNKPELLIPGGSWAMNLTRGLMIMLCRLAFLAALGLTAGCLLSMPVAVFVAFFVMVVLTSSGYVQTVARSGEFFVPHESSERVPSTMDKAILGMFRGMNVVTQPLLELDPVPRLTEGRRLGWDLTAQAVGWLVGLYTSVTALIGIALFNRRELG